MRKSAILVTVVFLAVTASCKIAEKGPAEDEADVTPPSLNTTAPAAPLVTAALVACTEWAEKSKEAFALEAKGSEGMATLHTALMLNTSVGRIPAGTYDLLEGSPGDGACLEYYADISSVLKVENTESSGMIVSNCDVAEEAEWRIKAYVRRVNGHDAEIVFDERYHCAVK